MVADVHRDPPRGQVMTQRVVAQSMFMQTVTHQHHSASSRGGQPAHHTQLTTRRTRSESKSIIQHFTLHSTRRRRTRSESKSIIQHSTLHSTRRRRTRSESKSIIQHSALHSTTRRRTRSESKSIIQHSALHSRTRRRTRSESKSIIQVHSCCRYRYLVWSSDLSALHLNIRVL